jgi:phenylpyruvate tautomerase PptA (4-oxalocrotonate tautomerase family)
MPIWKITHPSNIFTSKSEKAALARQITDWYVGVGLPDYYVNVTFYKLSDEDFFSAGTSTSEKVLIEIIHIARHQDPTKTERVMAMKDSFDRLLKPYTLDNGLELEFNIIEAPAWLWRINGIDPPEAFGPEDKEQAETNRKRLDELREKKTT